MTELNNSPVRPKTGSVDSSHLHHDRSLVTCERELIFWRGWTETVLEHDLPPKEIGPMTGTGAETVFAQDLFRLDKQGSKRWIAQSGEHYMGINIGTVSPHGKTDELTGLVNGHESKA